MINRLNERYNNEKNNGRHNKSYSNQLLNNNMYNSSLHDSNFYNKMMFARQQKISEIRSIDDLGIDKKKIAEYVICPIKVEVGKRSIINSDFDKKKRELDIKYIKNNYWKNRTNTPYKSIIKDKKWWDKNRFRKLKEKDLVYYRAKKSDKSKALLLKEYKKLQDILDNDNNEIKKEYSEKNRDEKKRNFDYVQKSKYRIDYNPKDYNDLKKIHREQQKKFNRNQKRYDYLMAQLIENEDLNKEDIKKIESELNYIDDTKKSTTKKKVKKNKKNNKNKDNKNLADDILDLLDDESSHKTKKTTKSKKKLSIKPISKEIIENDSDVRKDKIVNIKNKDKIINNKSKDKVIVNPKSKTIKIKINKKPKIEKPKIEKIDEVKPNKKKSIKITIGKKK